jgi:hypothetical protein
MDMIIPEDSSQYSLFWYFPILFFVLFLRVFVLVGFFQKIIQRNPKPLKTGIQSAICRFFLGVSM